MTQGRSHSLSGPWSDQNLCHHWMPLLYTLVLLTGSSSSGFSFYLNFSEPVNLGETVIWAGRPQEPAPPTVVSGWEVQRGWEPAGNMVSTETKALETESPQLRGNTHSRALPGCSDDAGVGTKNNGSVLTQLPPIKGSGTSGHSCPSIPNKHNSSSKI